MRPSTLAEIKKIVKKIYTGNFTVSDIKTLFADIRFHVPKKSTLKEIGDFVGHPDEKNQGKLVRGISAFAYGVYNFSQTHYIGKKIDLQSKFPSYLKKFLFFNLDKFSDQELLNHCGKNKAQLRNQIEHRIKINESDKTATLWMRDWESEDLFYHIYSFLEGINLISSRIFADPLLKQKEIISELWSYLNSIITDFNKSAFLKQEQKIILCILIIIHDTRVEIELPFPGYFLLGHGESHHKKTGDGKIILDGTETLKIFFQQELSTDWSAPPTAIIILETDLQIKDWIEDSLFQSGVDRYGLHVTIPVKLSGNFKLEAYKD